jgi:hypothetical protein
VPAPAYTVSALDRTHYIKEGIEKSEAAAERRWLTTEAGKEHMMIKHTLKAWEKLISSIKTRPEVLTAESRNSY